MTESAADNSPKIARPVVVGADHRSSSMAMRDRLFMDEASLPGFAATLREANIRQAIILSTEDRVEILAIHEDFETIGPRIAEIMAHRAGLDAPDTSGQIYVKTDADAIRHVFAEAAALDSVVIGEPRAQRALKQGHEHAAAFGMDGPGLQTLLNAAFDTANRVHIAAGFEQCPASISAAALRVALDLHGSLDRCTGLLIGAGHLGATTAEELIAAGLKDLTVVHRTISRAENLAAKLDCHFGDTEDLPKLLAKSEIVITAMNTRRYVVDREMVDEAIAARRHRPILLIDTGVPGDVDPDIDNLADAFRYSLDDLERVAHEGRAEREAEADKGWNVIDAEVREFIENGGLGNISTSTSRSRVEELRQAALADSGDDADAATRLLIDRLADEPKPRRGFFQRLFGPKER